MHKYWVNKEATKSFTWREVKTIELFMDSFKHLLKISSVTFFTNNQNAACIIKKGRKIPELQTLALLIYSICVYHNISLFSLWIPKEENEKADALSKIIDINDLGISFAFFNFVDNM